MDSASRRRVAGIVCAVGTLLIARVGMGKAHIVYYVSDRGFHAITRDGTARRSLARVLHREVLRAARALPALGTIWEDWT
ncbi:MAG: hypothetical protein ABGY41_19225, partial [Candidatus Poribacteria bacterium]